LILAWNFCDLHFGGRVEALPATLNVCDRTDIKYVLNFKGAPIGWKPLKALKNDLENRRGFLGFVLDEADHMQINAHWPVVDYYGYEDRHFLVETEGLDLFAARQSVLTSLRSRNEACTVAGKSATVEHLFPIMMRPAARAGPENIEWLNIWSLLSHGFVRTDAISHQWEARRFGSRTLFIPLHNVAVYNHEVRYDTLDGVRLIFLTGVAISPETLGAVQRRVQEVGHLRLASASGTSRFRNGEDQGTHYRAGWQRQMVSRE
jgi:hypothetical protein